MMRDCCKHCEQLFVLCFGITGLCKLAAVTEMHGLCLATEDMQNLGKKDATAACEAWLMVVHKRHSRLGTVAVCSQPTQGLQNQVVQHENRAAGVLALYIYGVANLVWI